MAIAFGVVFSSAENGHRERPVCPQVPTGFELNWAVPSAAAEPDFPSVTIARSFSRNIGGD